LPSAGYYQTDTKHKILLFVALQYKGYQTHEENPSASRSVVEEKAKEVAKR
jgi:hypothetical protein